MAPGVELASWRGEPVPPGEAGRAAAARRSWGNRVFPASGVIGARPGAVVTGRTRSSMPPHSSCRARPGPVGAGPPGVEHDQSAGGRPLPPGSASTGWAGKDVRRDRGRGDQVPDGGRRGPQDAVHGLTAGAVLRADAGMSAGAADPEFGGPRTSRPMWDQWRCGACGGLIRPGRCDLSGLRLHGPWRCSGSDLGETGWWSRWSAAAARRGQGSKRQLPLGSAPGPCIRGYYQGRSC